MCRWEATELDRHLHLADVDEELHDAYACGATSDAVEVTSLHSYATLMWCKDAQASAVVCKNVKRNTCFDVSSQRRYMASSSLDRSGNVIIVQEKSDKGRAISFLEHANLLYANASKVLHLPSTVVLMLSTEQLVGSAQYTGCASEGTGADPRENTGVGGEANSLQTGCPVEHNK